MEDPKGVWQKSAPFLYLNTNLNIRMIDLIDFEEIPDSRFEQEVNLFNHYNCSFYKLIYQSGELTPEQVNMFFRVILKVLVLQKEIVLKGSKSLVHENTYYSIEDLLYKYFDKLSSENKVYAELLLKHFCQSTVAGPAYASRLLTGDISLGDKQKERSEAGVRLAAIVYSLTSPWLPVSRHCSYLLAQMIHKGWIAGFTQEENDKKAAMILFRHRGTGEPADKKFFHTLGVDAVEFVKKEFHTEFQKDLQQQQALFKALHMEVNEFLVAADILNRAAKDVCLSIAPVEELTLRPFFDVLIEYFNTPENIPDLSDVDLEKMMGKFD